jgi:hypothetical protein
MATFYLLPPRPFLAERFAGFLQTFMPGLDWDADTRSRMADVVGAAAAGRPGVYLVFREDLPAGEPAARALVDGCGAEPGDEVVEVRPGPHPGDLLTRRWRVGPGVEGPVP